MDKGFKCLQNSEYEPKHKEELDEREDYIDFLNKEISGIFQKLLQRKLMNPTLKNDRLF